jgi:hypothetical protein
MPHLNDQTPLLPSEDRPNRQIGLGERQPVSHHVELATPQSIQRFAGKRLINDDLASRVLHLERANTRGKPRSAGREREHADTKLTGKAGCDLAHLREGPTDLLIRRAKLFLKPHTQRRQPYPAATALEEAATDSTFQGADGLADPRRALRRFPTAPGPVESRDYRAVANTIGRRSRTRSQWVIRTVSIT